MKDELFREKSLKRVRSQESLDDYIRVAAPGVWLLIASVLLLLAGAFVWLRFGHAQSAPAEAARAQAAVCRAPEEERVCSGQITADGVITLPAPVN